jgi:hypothetical protein
MAKRRRRALPIKRVYSYHLSPIRPSELKKLRKGDRIRIYCYSPAYKDVYVREGVVLNPSTTKAGSWFWHDCRQIPALFLEVQRRGITRDDRLERVKPPYKRRYSHRNIGLVERL